jgi:hypothetical protein
MARAPPDGRAGYQFGGTTLTERVEWVRPILCVCAAPGGGANHRCQRPGTHTHTHTQRESQDGQSRTRCQQPPAYQWETAAHQWRGVTAAPAPFLPPIGRRWSGCMSSRSSRAAARQQAQRRRACVDAPPTVVFPTASDSFFVAGSLYLTAQRRSEGYTPPSYALPRTHARTHGRTHTHTHTPHPTRHD